MHTYTTAPTFFSLTFTCFLLLLQFSENETSVDVKPYFGDNMSLNLNCKVYT